MTQKTQIESHVQVLQNWLHAQADQRSALRDLLEQSCMRALQGLSVIEGAPNPIAKVQEQLKALSQDQIPAPAMFLLVKSEITLSLKAEVLHFAAFTAESPDWLRSLIPQDYNAAMLSKDLTQIPCPRCSAQALVYAGRHSPGQLIEFKVQGERARQNVPLALSAHGYSVQSKESMANDVWKIIIKT